MKVVLFMLVCCLQQILTNASILAFLGLDHGPECITSSQLYKATEVLCGQRNNTDLWAKVIKCHRPMTDKFLRASREAQCPLPPYVLEPNNTKNSIEDVFLNICGIVDGSWWQSVRTRYCLEYGQSKPYIMSHKEAVARVKSTWGDNVLPNIGKCVLRLNLIDEE